jgi:hypothetical protein
MSLLGLTAFVTEALALRISPVEFDVVLPKATDTTFDFRMQNDEGEPLQIKVKLCDWIRGLNGANLFCDEAGEVPRSATAWTEIAPAQFELEPDQIQEIRVTLSAPAQAQDGSVLDGTYWTAIIVEAAPKEEGGGGTGTEIVVKRRFAVKLYATIAGTGTRDGQVSNLERHGLNPLWVTFEFTNRGTLNLKGVSGRVEVRDVTGATLETIPVEPFPVLPGYTRRIAAASARPRGEALPAGIYVVLAILDYGGENLVGAQLVLRIPELDLRPLGDGENPPADLDGDAFYEDVDGDGELTPADPVLLGEHLEEPVVQENWRAFDYNNDGLVDFDDVLTLRAWAEDDGSSQLP